MSIQSAAPDLPQESETSGRHIGGLPVTRPLTWDYAVALLVALLTAVASLAGLLLPETVYPTAALREAFFANDLVNLFIGLPILLGSLWLARRGVLIGLLFWPGALFYGLYNYLVYLMGMPLNAMFPFYLLLVTLSIYATIGVVASIDGRTVQQRVNGRVPQRVAGGVLALLGLIIILRSAAELTGSITSQTAVPAPTLALLVADFVVAPAWILGGVLLWRRRALGYVGGAGLLFQASMLFIGLLAIMILQPLMNGASFSLVDFVIVIAMSMICIVPFTLFVRGVARA